MKIIDLSLELYDGLRSFSSHPAIRIDTVSSFASSGKNYLPPCEGFESRRIAFSDHSGTHIDAPLHFIREGASAADLDLKKTMGQAILLDVSAMKKPYEAVSAAILERAVQKQGIDLDQASIVLIQTRKGQWGEGTFFEEAALDRSAGEWLGKGGFDLVGIDLANIDVNEAMDRPVHMDLLGQGIYIVENLVALDRLPRDRTFQFFALPLKIANGTASPVRAIACIEA